MKYFASILLLLSLAGLTYLNQSLEQKFEKEKSQIPATYFRNGLLKSQFDKYSPVNDYKIKAELFPDQKRIRAIEKIIWRNKSNVQANEIYFHLYPNSLKNNNTLFTKGRSLKLKPENFSAINFTQTLLNGQPINLIYEHLESKTLNDSTVAKIILPSPVLPGDSAIIDFVYSLSIPKSMERFGYAAGRNFFFISQWFPKTGVFENGKWICSPYYPFTNYFSDFGNYDVSLTVPDNYKVAATGMLIDSASTINKCTYSFSQAGVHDFAWMAADVILSKNAVYRRTDGTGVIIKTFIQPESEQYTSRYITAVKNALAFCEKYIGIYPYETLTLIDVPKTSQAGGMEYPTLITVGAELFSPPKTLQPELLVIHEFTHQYFYGILANNEVIEAWLDEGLASYISTKIANKYYGQASVNFKLFGYYPVFGLNLISYNELPLVYSLGEYKLPEGALSLSRYYEDPSSSTIADTSFMAADNNAYKISAYSKPELMLLSLERYLGFSKMMSILHTYYNSYLFSHPRSKDFLQVVQDNSPENMSWFFDNIFYSSSVFDYRIRYVRKTEIPNEYEIFAERLTSGIFKQQIAIYTDKDTTMLLWDGKDKWKKLFFKTPNELLGAELDPKRINILDLNYANNSYTIHNQYGGSISISLRWFFWIQNLILILGSAA